MGSMLARQEVSLLLLVAVAVLGVLLLHEREQRLRDAGLRSVQDSTMLVLREVGQVGRDVRSVQSQSTAGVREILSTIREHAEATRAFQREQASVVTRELERLHSDVDSVQRALPAKKGR